jgi:hypothetical protein
MCLIIYNINFRILFCFWFKRSQETVWLERKNPLVFKAVINFIKQWSDFLKELEAIDNMLDQHGIRCATMRYLKNHKSRFLIVT